jgi:hypothetical protein
MAKRAPLSSAQQLELDRYRLELRYEAAVRLGSLGIGKGFKWGFWAWLAYQTSLAVRALAGKTTLAAFWVYLNANLGFGTKVSIALNVSMALWVYFERRLRKSTTARLAGRVRAFEQARDPERSSSLLTARGDTRPEDQL